MKYVVDSLCFFQEGITVICSRLYMFNSCLQCTRLHDRIWEHPPPQVVFMAVGFILSHGMIVGNVTFKNLR